MSMFTRAFVEDFAERAVGTFAQSLLGALPVAYVADIDWINALYVALFATGIFCLKGLAAGAADRDSGASFGTTIPRETVRTVSNENSPTDISSEEGSDLGAGVPVFEEEPYVEKDK